MASPAPVAPLIELNCTICKEPYDNGQRIPQVIFSCGHTFCAPCIKEQTEKNGNICPLDRKAFSQMATNWSLVSSASFPSSLAAQVKATSSSACSAAVPTVAIVPKNPSPEEGQPALREPFARARFNQAMQCASFNRAEAASLLEQIILMPDAEDKIKAMARHYLAQLLDPKDPRITVLLEQVIQDPHVFPEQQAADRFLLAKRYLATNEAQSVTNARFLLENFVSDPHAREEDRAEACRLLAGMHLRGIGGLAPSCAQAGVYYERVLANPRATATARSEAHSWIGMFHLLGADGYVQSDGLAMAHVEEIQRIPEAEQADISSVFVHYCLGIFHLLGRGGCEISDEKTSKHFRHLVFNRHPALPHDEVSGWLNLITKSYRDLEGFLDKDISLDLRKAIIGELSNEAISKETCAKIYIDDWATTEQKIRVRNRLLKCHWLEVFTSDVAKRLCREAIDDIQAPREVKDEARLALALGLKEDPESDDEVRALLAQLHGAEVDIGVRKKALFEMALLVKAGRGGENPPPLKNLFGAVIGGDYYGVPEEAQARYELALLLSENPASIGRARGLLNHFSFDRWHLGNLSAHYQQAVQELRAGLGQGSRCSIQ